MDNISISQGDATVAPLNGYITNFTKNAFVYAGGGKDTIYNGYSADAAAKTFQSTAMLVTITFTTAAKTFQSTAARAMT